MTTSQIMLKPEIEATCQGKHGHTTDSCKEETEDADPSLRSLMEDEASTDRSQSESKSADTLQTVEGMCLDGQCIGQEKVEQAKIDGSCSTNGAPGSEKERCATTSNHSGSERTTKSEVNKLTVSEAEEATAAARGERRESSTDGEELLQVQIHSVSEAAVPDAASAPASSLFYQSHDGDLNFSGPRGSSGHIAYSGSISMRSDSSTTSTRSFAFPILTREWNASPVKMAKARKHRWRLMGLNCCKF